MHLALVDGEGVAQVGGLLLAFVLSSLIGLERQLRGKSAGLRTQSIVGTTSALMLLVGKYGFSDVLDPGTVALDPSRVAAQVVSGVGFLGAGLILTHRGAVRGLTTAAAVWEVAGIGMAAGAGLPLLALLVTALHFVAVFGFTALARRLPGNRSNTVLLRLSYLDGRGVLRPVLTVCTAAGWGVRMLRHETAQPDDGDRRVAVTLGLTGSRDVPDLLARLADVEGVLGVERVAAEDLD